MCLSSCLQKASPWVSGEPGTVTNHHNFSIESIQENPFLKYEKFWFLTMSMEVWKKSTTPRQWSKKEGLKATQSLVSDGCGVDYPFSVVSVAFPLTIDVGNHNLWLTVMVFLFIVSLRVM